MPKVLTETDDALCVGGKHRFLPDAPQCGCGAVINVAVGRERLEREVIEAAKEEYCADEQYRWRQARRKAVKALLEFESKEVNGNSK